MYALRPARAVTFDDDGSVQVIESPLIVIEGAHIVSVDSDDRAVTHLDHIEVVDVPELTVVPGLIDTHVHLAFDGGADPVATMQASSAQDLLDTMRANARDLLAAGVTTARDLGAPAGLEAQIVASIERGELAGPRLLTSGRPVTTPTGHLWYMGGGCASAEDARRVIGQNVAAGAQWTKVAGTGGGHTAGTVQWLPQFSDEELTNIVALAREAGTGVAVHAHGTDGIRQAARCAVDTIEHCSWLGPAGIDFDEVLAIELAVSRIPVCPTVNSKWKHVTSRREERLPQVRRMHELGVALVAGTDAGIGGVRHASYADGLDVLAMAGMAPIEVLRAATALAAKALGLGGQIGRLAPGFSADLIGVHGDPTRSHTCLRYPALVMSRGRLANNSLRTTHLNEETLT